MIGKKVRLVRLNKCRFVFEDGFVETKLSYMNSSIEWFMGHEGIVEQYDKEYNIYLVRFGYTKVWLHRNEFLVLIKNLLK